ncbi:MAG: type II secretion system secretin GspD [Acidobacteria bacterium]|nr:type II secretion system secretin GspD [Acidobacteriota bacterium]
MSINKSWSAIILFTFMLAGSLCPAAPAPQERPRRIPLTEEQEEERLRTLERLRDQLNQNRPLPKQPAQQEEPAAPEPAAPAQTQSSLQASNGKLRLIFNDADLIAFIRQISELLSLTPLVIDSDVQGTVTIHSSEPMTKDEVRALFNLILKTKNVSLIEQNGIYQVVPISSALRTGVDLIEHPTPGADAEPAAEPAAESYEIPRLSTNVVSVEFMPVKDLIEPIKLLMTEGGVIMPYERLNMLILTDYSDSIERILQIIHMLDDRYMDPDLIELIKIEHNASADVVADLQKMFGSGEKDSSTGISFISLDRMNSIFVIAASKRGLEEVKRWIDILDTTTGRSIQNNVYIVKNSTASNIATLLSALYGGEGTAGTLDQGSSPTGSQRGQIGGSLGSALGQSTGQRGSFGTFTNQSSSQSGNYAEGGYAGGMMGGGMFGGGQQLNPQFSASRGISSVIIQGGEFSGLQDTIRLVVDDINNRLFIQSTAADYQFILEAIVSMDVMPRQVRIDASIYEVDLTDDLSFGVGAALRERTGGSTTEFYLNSSTEGTPSGFTAVNVALIGSSQELISALNALREKTNVKVLENPTVFAMDGKEAYITVGAEIPYYGATYSTNVTTSTAVQYRDTGVTLFVRPRISESGSITMDVLQEVSGVGVNTSLGPTFTKSRVETTLIVKDGETVAIAGLIRDSDSLTRTGFPIISDIPILGSLFGQTTKSKRRSELVILITPHVIGNADTFNEITKGFKDSMRNVRKFTDKTERERVQDAKDAIEERIEAEEKQRLKEERERQRQNRK